MFAGMLLYRSLTTGLLGTCVLLLINVLARSPMPPLRVPPMVIHAPSLAGAATPTIIDVSPAISADALASLVPLGSGEHVLAVADRPMRSDLEAGAAIAGSGLTSGHFLDLTIGSAQNGRRVLLLMH